MEQKFMYDTVRFGEQHWERLSTCTIALQEKNLVSLSLSVPYYYYLSIFPKQRDGSNVEIPTGSVKGNIARSTNARRPRPSPSQACERKPVNP
jgi:hypothetical protein